MISIVRTLTNFRESTGELLEGLQYLWSDWAPKYEATCILQGPKMVNMLELHAGYISPTLVVTLERRLEYTPPQLKRPVVTLEPHSRRVVMREWHQDYVPLALALKNVITFERRPKLTPPSARKPVITLKWGKVVELQQSLNRSLNISLPSQMNKSLPIVHTPTV